jgi:hypothetical protein
VEAADGPGYWLDLEIKAQARLRQLDRFLRDVWLECCGHLSAFTIRGVRYEVAAGAPDALFAPFDGPRSHSMHARVGEAVWPGLAFHYEYDFGSTTGLRLKTVGAREGWIGRRPLRLLARNEPPVWQCTVCGVRATNICAWCADENVDAFFCKTHAGDHVAEAHEGDEAPLLPVVNSPRMGVCAYAGPVDDRYEVLSR